MARSLDLDELVEHWTLLDDEQALIAGKRGATRLGFSLLLKFYGGLGRFPRGRSELPDEAVAFVARQVGVPASELGFYEWSGSTIAFHRAQIRSHLGFRECSVADADALTGWLATNVCQAERRPELVRGELLARCRAEQIEPPAGGRIERIMRSALHQGEQVLTARIVERMPDDAAGRLAALVDVQVRDDAEALDSVLALIKSVPGNVSLDSMLTEIRKLRAVRAIGLPTELFADVAPRVLASWRARAAVESPSHLRAHPRPLMLVLLAALLHTRQQEGAGRLDDHLPAIGRTQRVELQLVILALAADSGVPDPDRVGVHGGSHGADRPVNHPGTQRSRAAFGTGFGTARPGTSSAGGRRPENDRFRDDRS